MIFSIFIKEPRTVQQVLEATSSQKRTGKRNKVHVITSRRDNNIVIKNLQENRSTFNQIRHIEETGNKLISPPIKSPTPDHIGDVVKIPLISDWYDSTFSNDEKMGKSTTFSAPFLRSSLPPDTKILQPRIYFRVKTADTDNQYNLYSRTCAYGSSLFKELTLLYHTHQWLVLSPFVSSLKLHLQKA